MRYYVYISDAKLDMLAEQIPEGFGAHLAAELKLDLKVLSASLSRDPSDRTRMDKLRLVEEYLTANGEVGTADAPKAYFWESMPMRWGPYVRNVLRGGPSTGLVFFGGRADTTYVGLGGSDYHLVGAERGESSPTAWSATPHLYAALAADLGQQPPREVLDPPGKWEDLYQSDEISLLATHRAIESMKGPVQHLEFLAKRLHEGRLEDGASAVLGSPIYVAQVD